MAKILQVCNSDFYLTKFLSPLILALLREGHDVECLCEGNNVPDFGDDVIVHEMNFPKSASPLDFLDSISEMRELFREKQYNCVNSHNRNASIIARIAAWQEKVPVNLYTAHGFYFHDDQSQLGRFATIIFECLLAKITDFTLSQSDEDTLFMSKRGCIKPELIKTIGNGIDTSRFKPNDQRDKFFRVGATGRLVKGKGFMDLINGFAQLHEKHPDSQLLLIGGNIQNDIVPFEQEILARIKELKLEDAIVITGLVDNVEDYLATCDVFVLPSYREGMPRALLEAMSMGIPAIATNIRGCREIVIEGENGYLYTAHDVKSLAQLLNQMYGQKDKKRKFFAENARSRIVHHFDEKDYINRQVYYINKLLRSI
jgi:glycosyltransferase involved in cell wall biosynthesis